MSVLIDLVVGLAILANAVVYGTDVFGAVVQRPAIRAVDDRTLVLAMGNIHRVADRRMAGFSIGGLLAAVVTTALAAATGRWVSTAAGGLATLALIVFVGVYLLISKPINAELTAAATAGEVPDDARELQTRWDSVINGRVALHTIALAALCTALAAT